MVFTNEELRTGRFTPDQLLLFKKMFYQPQLEGDPLFVYDKNLPDVVRLRAVSVSAQIAYHPLRGWLLLDSDESPIKFHQLDQKFWEVYGVLENT